MRSIYQGLLYSNSDSTINKINNDCANDNIKDAIKFLRNNEHSRLLDRKLNNESKKNKVKSKRKN